ncbi:MAG TPA: hypothetical protein VF215_06065 [Thermoanaerobaculia bacterium]
MWHPSPEELARLVDETPTTAEAEHLAACADCAAELDAMRSEHGALGALPRILPVPTSWEVMRRRLEREHLIGAGPRIRWMPGIAAALALFLTGAVAGVALAGGFDADARSVAVVNETGTAAALYDARLALDSATPQPATTFEVEDVPAPATRAQPPVKLASQDPMDLAEDELPSLYGTPAPGPSVAPNWQVLAARASNARTPDEAAGFVRDAETAYLAAMTRLAELTEAQSTDPAVRLATLDGIVVTTAAALERAPADPVINGYYLAARAQRDALLRTVSSSPEQDPWY